MGLALGMPMAVCAAVVVILNRDRKRVKIPPGFQRSVSSKSKFNNFYPVTKH